MHASAIGQRGGFSLTEAERARLERHAAVAVRRARRSGEALLALSVVVPENVDPSAIVAASRRPDEPWFAFEQPDSEGFALAALGCAKAIEEAGEDRFEKVSRTWRALASNAAADP